MESPAEALVRVLRDAGASVATAESLTGGRLAARLTEAPGSSVVYAGGVVSYQTHIKVEVLGVPQDLVEAHGVVSAECARAMADGARRLLGTAYALSTTGVAGPDRQEGKPVGTVYVGLAGPGGTRVLDLTLAGDRSQIQAATVDAAVGALIAELDGEHAAARSRAGQPPEDSGLG
ncbi:CinA family protein [Nocardioides daeguensis]|uniref:CinA C-terminal domain-containing protein n=1 Tax=Nocardioides daeguensis TaxID=908359 RepID=A0ABP6VVJ9_9ACTN|nr:CinA family protein [Nocardioides daeguensis]MBV6726931.1 CinA family protein [Nocardioides daeguensis]MCR1772930.1 CinA family protein [Nocardioides daeguensis]